MLTYDLPMFSVSGDPVAMGEALGKQLADAVQRFVAQRLRAAKVYLWEHGTRNLDGFLRLGSDSYNIFCDWDPAGALEHDALAMAAGVSPQELYTTTNMTDIRDILLVQLRDAGLQPPVADAEGCTTVLVGGKRSADGEILASQTWDLNPQDVDDVVAVHRRPDAGPATWSVTCNGCPTLMGINEHGLSVGTTNIKTDDSRIGVGYLSILHRAIRCQNVAEAIEVVQSAPRAAAHTYWLAAADGARIITTSATTHHDEILADDGVLGQTNHVCHDLPAVASLEAPSSSSTTRLATVEHWAGIVQGADVDSIKRLFAERGAGSDSINRYPEDDTGSATDACLITSPAQKKAWACRGPADRGIWYELDPVSGSSEVVAESD